MAREDWVSLSEFKEIRNEATSISCDTRDFHVRVGTTALEPYKYDSDDVYYKRFNKLFNQINSKFDFGEDYIIDSSEILSFINALNDLAATKKTIIMSFNVEHCKWWLKYLRFYRLKSNENKFVVTNDGYPIEWRKVNENTFTQLKYSDDE